MKWPGHELRRREVIALCQSGQYEDRQIAKMVGLSRSRVAAIRKDAGIAARTAGPRQGAREVRREQAEAAEHRRLARSLEKAEERWRAALGPRLYIAGRDL